MSQLANTSQFSATIYCMSYIKKTREWSVEQALGNSMEEIRRQAEDQGNEIKNPGAFLISG